MDEYDVDEALQQALDRLTALAHISSALAGTLDARAGLERACRILAQRLVSATGETRTTDGGSKEGRSAIS
nr:hypothetical protein [Streptomyces sp. TLI_235]